MKSFLPTVGLRTLASVLLIATGALAFPGKAEARCGDYVRVSGQDHPAVDVHSQSWTETVFMMDEAGIRPTSRSGQPCSGPTCSSRKDRPIAPAPAPGEIAGRNWGLLNSLTVNSASEGEWFRTADFAVAPHWAPGMLFRPPR